jgi:hypothetical protein
LNNTALYNDAEVFSESINFDNNRLFNIYFYKYTNWKNKAFEQLEKNYGKKHSLLISLDIKSYFYSVKFDFNKINVMLNQDENLESFKVLTKLFAKVYERYAEIIKPYNSAINSINEKELPLPIGLFSSMLLGNIYLSDFDKKVIATEYYGRYVDDILFVFDADKVDDTSIKSVINNTMIKSGLLNEMDNNNYTLLDKSNLKVQNSKIKIIHIDPKESKTIIDVYNKNIKIIPSQMNVLPDFDLNITDFEESAYIVENLTQEKKLRDIGNMTIDAFRVSRYLSTLVQKQKSITYKGEGDYEQNKNIKEQIEKINKFFIGNQSIEFYSNWLNILYFLMLKGDKNEFKSFCKKIKDNISNLKFISLDNEINFKRRIGRKTKDALIEHLDICISTALALRYNLLTNLKYQDLTNKLQKSNMFNHYLTSYPLINYIENGVKPICLATIALKDIAGFERNLQDNFKIKWSPRFIKLEELFLYWFIYKFDAGGNNYVTTTPETNRVQEIIERFYQINNIKSKNIEVNVNSKESYDKYILQNIKIVDKNKIPRDKLKIAVANIKISEKDCSDVLKNPWSTLTQENKKELFKILKQAYGNGKDKVDFLILPEFYLPLKWLNEVIDFSRKSQIAIITGIQYLTDNQRLKIKDIKMLSY